MRGEVGRGALGKVRERVEVEGVNRSGKGRRRVELLLFIIIKMF